MKIDVEGHELEVLKGAAGLVEQDKPVLLIEIEERHCPGNLKEVPKWLARFGYLLWVLDDKGTTLVEVAGVADAARAGINNFWFLPA
jgi:hypothetical protein